MNTLLCIVINKNIIENIQGNHYNNCIKNLTEIVVERLNETIIIKYHM